MSHAFWVFPHAQRLGEVRRGHGEVIRHEPGLALDASAVAQLDRAQRPAV
ncbi:MAG: hypothetical protein AAF721_07500 [Myxococcota bacterium]